MIRLVCLDLYGAIRHRAKRFDWQGVLPQAHSIEGVLTIAARPRHGEPHWWSVWIVEPWKDRWWERPHLPRFQYDLSAEKSIVWRNSLPQRHGLAVREGVVDHVEGLPFEVLAFTTGGDLRRVWFHDRTKPDGFEGVSPFVKPGHISKPHTSANLAAAKQMHEAYHPGQIKITEGGMIWS
jgi:hypothetical protein